VKPVSLSDYFERSGDTEICGKGPLIQNEHGFMVWSVTNEAVIAWQVYGDAGYWDQCLQDLARTFRLPKIQFMTRRSPKAWARKLGYKQIAVVMEKGV